MTRLTAALLSFVMLAGVLGTNLLAAGQVCPRCGAPIEPGAMFCTRCGLKLDASGAATPAPPHPDTRVSVVQVVAAHDKELTSTFGAIAYKSGVRIDSILGSAFAIAPNEFVTDASLIVGAKGVALHTASGRSVPAEIVGTDPMIGIGLLKADLPEIVPLTFRLGGPPSPGETLSAFGFPSAQRAGQEVVSSAGVVSGLHRGGFRIHPIEDYIQSDTSLPDGFAGGPVLDKDGHLAGMNTAWVFGSDVVLGPEMGIGVSIPADWIGRAVEWIRGGVKPRTWIGAYTVPADAEMRAAYSLPDGIRRVVDEIFPGSPAATAGLRRGDGLLNVQGENPVSFPALQHRLMTMSPGQTVTLEIARGKETLSLSATLAPRPERPRLAAADALRLYGGFDVAPRGRDGLVVGRVLQGSYAADAKLASGDVLESVLSKKDIEHESRKARWRSAESLQDLNARLETAYSEYDFFVGLRFRGKDGARRELYLWDILGPTSAL